MASASTDPTTCTECGDDVGSLYWAGPKMEWVLCDSCHIKKYGPLGLGEDVETDKDKMTEELAAFIAAQVVSLSHKDPLEAVGRMYAEQCGADYEGYTYDPRVPLFTVQMRSRKPIKMIVLETTIEGCSIECDDGVSGG